MKLRCQFSQPEEVFISQGDDKETHKNLYFLAKGECDVTVKDQSGTDSHVALLTAGCHFGEISLLTEFPRTATVISKNYCTIACLSRVHFKSLVKKFPETESIL